MQIVDFQPKYSRNFKELNTEWLTRYFSIEEGDRVLLDYPEENIISKGGKIIFAIIENKIIGTCALIKQDNDVCELSKMAVNEGFQGLGIGKKILGHMIDFAIKKKYKKMVLLSSPKLSKAISIYKNAGFVEQKLPENLGGHYSRCSIYMELRLN